MFCAGPSYALPVVERRTFLGAAAPAVAGCPARRPGAAYEERRVGSAWSQPNRSPANGRDAADGRIPDAARPLRAGEGLRSGRDACSTVRSSCTRPVRCRDTRWARLRRAERPGTPEVSRPAYLVGRVERSAVLEVSRRWRPVGRRRAHPDTPARTLTLPREHLSRDCGCTAKRDVPDCPGSVGCHDLRRVAITRTRPGRAEEPGPLEFDFSSQPRSIVRNQKSDALRSATRETTMSHPEPEMEAGGTPRWVKIFGVLLVLLLLLVVAVALSGGHGPGLHSP